MSQMPPEDYWWRQVQLTQANQAGDSAPVMGSRENPWADEAHPPADQPVNPDRAKSYGDMMRGAEVSRDAQAQRDAQRGPEWLQEYMAQQPAAKPQPQIDPWTQARLMTGRDTTTTQGPGAIGPTNYNASGDPQVDFQQAQLRAAALDADTRMRQGQKVSPMALDAWQKWNAENPSAGSEEDTNRQGIGGMIMALMKQQGGA